jgi:hypothetical protein
MNILSAATHTRFGGLFYGWQVVVYSRSREAKGKNPLRKKQVHISSKLLVARRECTTVTAHLKYRSQIDRSIRVRQLSI